MDAAPHNRLIAIVGATASGKSDAAVMIANQLSGEVINADSRLFYRGMEIGTATPPPETLAQVPHHLIGFLDPEQRFSLAEFLSMVGNRVRDVQTRGNLPVLTGGTGQYVWGLLEGWQVPAVPPDAALRAELERDLSEHGVDALYSRLREQAPEVAAATDGKNHRRVIRALERVAAGADQNTRAAQNPGYDSLVIGLYVEREELHHRIAERVDRMLEAGWVDEVRSLIDHGVDFSSPALSAIGYREVFAAISGEITPIEARERTIRATNRLVRHQNNWFKQTDDRITWVDVTAGDLQPAVDVATDWATR